MTQESDVVFAAARRKAPRFLTEERWQFRLFLADRVSFTSTQFGGGDWRWQFCSPTGEILAECGGYSTELGCRNSILRLQKEAASATLPSQD
ncbi:YegP family protein [Altererythrobacter sp. Root672]|uniref:YegP family protein n=1 Tax=Altererythrobacter sp. Root672 TaxID=1736584 RepID=UPI00138ED092|nr:YegP family protein [Altererythrobacter sp. Root672]